MRVVNAIPKPGHRTGAEERLVRSVLKTSCPGVVVYAFRWPKRDKSLATGDVFLISLRKGCLSLGRMSRHLMAPGVKEEREEGRNCLKSGSHYGQIRRT